MSDRTWETQNPNGDAAYVDPGVTHNRTTKDYDDECRKALKESEPGKLRNW